MYQMIIDLLLWLNLIFINFLRPCIVCSADHSGSGSNDAGGDLVDFDSLLVAEEYKN